MTNDELLERISIDPAICGGKPCIRGHRIWVSLILDLLASGRTHDEILAQYPQLEPDDLRACIAHGAEMTPERTVHVWIASRLDQEVEDAPRVGDAPPTSAARRTVREWIEEHEAIFLDDEGLSVDIHGDGIGGVVIVVDHDPTGRRVVAEVDSNGCLLTMKKVTSTSVQPLPEPIEEHVEFEALRWLSARPIG